MLIILILLHLYEWKVSEPSFHTAMFSETVNKEVLSFTCNNKNWQEPDRFAMFSLHGNKNQEAPYFHLHNLFNPYILVPHLLWNERHRHFDKWIVKLLFFTVASLNTLVFLSNMQLCNFCLNLIPSESPQGEFSPLQRGLLQSCLFSPCQGKIRPVTQSVW